MLFNTYEFVFIFLPAVLLVYFLIFQSNFFHKNKILTGWLLLSSLVFYGWWNPFYLTLLIFSVIFNFSISALIVKYRSKNIAKLTIFCFGIFSNLLLIGIYKYANFFVDNINNLFNLSINMGYIILPLAISFFTFQQIAYLVDTYKGKSFEKNIFDYSLFVVFFPQLIAGPIVHHKEMLPQFGNLSKNRELYSDFCIGLTIFSIGLFKKVFIADQLSLVADAIFGLAEDGKELHAIQAFTGCFAYSFQLYFDFSGYSDMAIGLARMFGVKLILNFNSPYRANNISDFWNRWHISLSRFLKNYLYIPLGGNRKGNIRRYTNLMIVMLIGGLWHGAGWTFVFWGGLHGAYLIFHHLWRRLWKVSINRWWSIMISRVITFFFVAIAWVFFRASSFDEAMIFINGMLTFPGASIFPVSFMEFLSTCTITECGSGSYGLDYSFIFYTALALLYIWVFPNTQELFYKNNPAYDYSEKNHKPSFIQRFLGNLQWMPSKYWATMAAVISWLSIIQLNQVKEFLYFQF